MQSINDRISHPSALSRYLPLLVWIAFISFASSGSFSASNTSLIVGPILHWLFPNASPDTLDVMHAIVRKIAHFLEYALLGVLAARAFRGSSKAAVRGHWFYISVALIVVYALVDEYHQSFVASRTASIYDSFIDMAGGLTAVLVVAWRSRRNTAPD
jgi:VanZ family protein